MVRPEPFQKRGPSAPACVSLCLVWARGVGGRQQAALLGLLWDPSFGLRSLRVVKHCCFPDGERLMKAAEWRRAPHPDRCAAGGVGAHRRCQHTASWQPAGLGACHLSPHITRCISAEKRTIHQLLPPHKREHGAESGCPRQISVTTRPAASRTRTPTAGNSTPAQMPSTPASTPAQCQAHLQSEMQEAYAWGGKVVGNKRRHQILRLSRAGLHWWARVLWGGGTQLKRGGPACCARS